MAMILAFQPRMDRPPKRPEKAGSAGSAGIIIFPGVRYERLDQRLADEIYGNQSIKIAKNCKKDLKSA